MHKIVLSSNDVDGANKQCTKQMHKFVYETAKRQQMQQKYTSEKQQY